MNIIFLTPYLFNTNKITFFVLKHEIFVDEPNRKIKMLIF